MDVQEKMKLVKRNTVEIVQEDELEQILKTKKKPVVYCGYEPSGPLHLGHFVTIIKLMDFVKAGFKVKVLLADLHARLNRKGEENAIEKETKAWAKTVKAIGLDAEIVKGSDFQFKKEYISDIIRMAQEVTINRGLRSMQEVARDIENATISQIWYPLMQIEDIKALGLDVACSGVDQRKIHMLGRELSKKTNHNFVAVHTPIIASLKGPGTKMSKSIPGSGISIVDSDEDIKNAISKAYCPERAIEENPILQISQLIIFPTVKSFVIDRPAKFGGKIEFAQYEDLEEAYQAGKIHPLDLKNTVTKELIKIIKPIRTNFKK